MADNTAVITDPLADITNIHARLTDSVRVQRYTKFRDYYDGTQGLEFASKKFQSAFGSMFATFAYNRSAAVVDAISDRLQLIGFDLEGTDQEGEGETDASGAELVKTDLATIWTGNRMDRKQGEVHNEAFKCGDAYVIVWPELQLDGLWLPKIYVNKAGTVSVVTDLETGKTISAAKAWRITSGPLEKHWRLTLYFEQGIYKFVSTAKPDEMPKQAAAWTPYDPTIEGYEPEPWPIPNPFLQVPVFHFANNAFTGEYGRSELRDVIPIQDALNKASMDLLVAMEYGAYRQRYVTGMSLGIPDPITGIVPSPFKTGPGEVWSGPAGATFGDFETTDLSQFLKVGADYDAKISNVARIPAHWLTMSMENPPSGEALKTAEAPFVAKLNDRQIAFGNVWEDIFALGLRMFGDPNREVVNLKAVWKSAELRSDRELAEVAVMKSAIGVPEEKLWTELGYTDAEIAEFKQLKEAAIADMQRQAAAGGLTPFPGAGGNPPPGNENTGE
jgi:hypothetical protein